MTLITWTCLRYVQEMATILGPQNRTQGSCDWFLSLTVLTSDLVVNVRLSLALGRPGLAWRNLLKSVDSRPQEAEAANSSLGHWGLGHTGLTLANLSHKPKD